MYKSHLSEIAKKASIAARTQREVCGELFLDGAILKPRILKNLSKRIGSWELRWTNLKGYKIQGRKKLGLLGTFHSHIASEAIPGKADEYALRESGIMLIYDSIGKEFRLWKTIGNEIKEVKLLTKA